MAPKVFRLVYAGFKSAQPEKMVEYYRDIQGMNVTEEVDGATFLSFGFDHYNVGIYPADTKGLQNIAYQVDPEVGLDNLQKDIEEFGISVERKALPGIEEALVFNDPSGVEIHLFTDIEQPATGFTWSGLEIYKLGHIALRVQNFDDTMKFYTEVLGFYQTDKIGEHFANFITCNYEHHVINFIAAEPEQATQLHHIAYQIKDSSHHTKAADWLFKHDYDTIWGPQRHTAGSNIAAYHLDPDEHVVELYADIDVYIPELNMMEPREWHQELPYRPKMWEGLSAWGTEYDFDLGGYVDEK